MSAFLSLAFGGSARPLDVSPVPEIQWPAGGVGLALDRKPADFGFDQPSGQIETAGDRAGNAARKVLGITTRYPLLNLPVHAVTFVVAPIWAGHAARGASERLDAAKLSECEANLAQDMAEMAVQERFHAWLLKAAREKGRPLIDYAATGLPRNESGSILEARVEELRLERTGKTDQSFALKIKTRTRLVRTSDGAVLFDHPEEYRSGSCLFLDWTLGGSLKGVADTGYRELAQRLAEQVLTVSDTPQFTGVGYARLGRQLPAGESAPVTRVSTHPSFNSGALGIFPGELQVQVEFQKPLTRDEAQTEVLDDLRLDGLSLHQNMYVSVAASVAMVPVSLWRQGVAAWRGFSPRKLHEAETKLAAVACQAQPQLEVTQQIAEQLTPLTSQPVLVARQPLPRDAVSPRVSFVSWETPGRLTTGESARPVPVAQRPDTALEVRVRSARLRGEEGINPALYLAVEAEATLVDTRDGHQIYSCPIRYRGQKRSFKQWAAKDAQLFREELQTCYRELGAGVANRLMVRGLVAPGARPATLAKN